MLFFSFLKPYMLVFFIHSHFSPSFSDLVLNRVITRDSMSFFETIVFRNHVLINWITGTFTETVYNTCCLVNKKNVLFVYNVLFHMVYFSVFYILILERETNKDKSDSD